MTLRVPCLSAFTAVVLMAAAVPTGAQANIEVGGLNCRSPGAVGLIVGAVLNFDCVFVPSAGGAAHRYVATVRRVGLDLGYTQNVTMGWVVFAPTAIIHPSDLAGSYAGVQAGATVGVGVGANALVGGSNNSFALQPVSTQGQSGLSVAAGLAGLELRPALAYAPRRERHERHEHHARHERHEHHERHQHHERHHAPS
jgi:uncharacterized protein DUF992